MTDHVVSIIRQQRHLATRVMIATQEPMLSPLLLDLCNVTIVHHFKSPAWYQTLITHIASVRLHGERNTDLFETIVSLKIGQALVFCPSALLDVQDDAVVSMRDDFMKLKIRARISADGGRSLLSSDKTSLPSSEILTPDTMVKPYVRPGSQLFGARRCKPEPRPIVSSPQPRNSSTSTSTPSGEKPTENGVRHATESKGSEAAVPSVPAVAKQMPPSDSASNAIPQSQQPSQPPESSKRSIPSNTQIFDALRRRTTTLLSTQSPQLDYTAIRAYVTTTLGLAPTYMISENGKKLSREAIRLEAVSDCFDH